MFMCSYLKTSKVYGNGMAMLGSLVMGTLYPSKSTFGQLKLRVGL